MTTATGISSRNWVFVGLVALLLIVGALVAAQSLAGTSGDTALAPVAAGVSAASAYQRSDQPNFVLPSSTTSGNASDGFIHARVEESFADSSGVAAERAADKTDLREIAPGVWVPR